MQFGAMNFPVTPVLDEIDTFARLGFDYLELAMDPPMAHYRSLFNNRKRVLRSLRATGMDVVCHLPTFVTTADLTDSLRQASVKEMHRSLELAADLGSKKVVLHPSMVGGMGAFVPDTVKRYAFDFLADMTIAAQRLNITICLENMFPRNRLGVEPDDFEEIFRLFPSLKLTLDTGHANIGDQRGRRLKSLVNRFGERIEHLHISDNSGRRDDHLAVGQGTVNFDEMVHRLNVRGYDGTVTLEIFDSDRTMLVKSRERIKALFESDSFCQQRTLPPE
jgi:sugar phosphate isomerase/epimerase